MVDANPNLFNVEHLEKLAEAQFVKLISEANGQYLLSSLFRRITEIPHTKCDLLEGKNYANHDYLYKQSGRPPVILPFQGSADPKTIEAAFSIREDADGRDVWNTFNNAQLTYLTPFVNFYSRFTDNNGQNEQIEPIPIQSVHPSIDTKSKDHFAAGRSNAIFGFLGLKDIDIELAGKYEETKYSDIKVDVTFAANTLHVMDSEVYLPLVIPHFKKNNMMGHQLILEYGWNTISDAAKKSLKFTKAQIKEISQQRQKYVLYYYKHNFSVDQDGSFTLVINYIARATNVLQNIDLGTPIGTEFEALYGNTPFNFEGTNIKQTLDQAPIVTDFLKNIGFADDEDYNSKIYKYIENNHPGATEKQRSIIKQYFYTIAAGKNKKDARGIQKLFTTRKQAISELAYEKMARIPSYLRENGVEFMLTIPHINRRAHYLRCAIISAHLDLMAKADPHPKEVSFGTLYEAALHKLAEDKPMKRVTNKVDFYNMANVAKESGCNIDGQGVFDLNVPFVSSLGTDNCKPSKRARQVTANQPRVLGFTYPAEHYWKKGYVTFDGAESGVAQTAFKADTLESKAELVTAYESIFFYRFGDLLEGFLEMTSGKQTFIDENIVFALGTCRVRQRFYNTSFGTYFTSEERDKREFYWPLADIPIERNEFINMINRRYINKSTSRITFLSFFNGLMNIVKKYYMVGDPILTPKLNQPARSVTMNMINTSFHEGNKFKERTAAGKWGYTLSDIRKLKPAIFSDPSKPAGNYNIFVVNAGATSPAERPKGENEKNYDTYRVGSAFSVVKRAKFNRVQTNAQKAVESDNVAAVAEDEAGGIIPHLFNVDVEMFGNVRFTPGYYFNLKPFAPKLVNKKPSPYTSQGILKRLGMDNLNVTITVNHKIGPNGFQTSLKSMAVQKNK